MNMYTDTERRMFHDAEFRTVVETLAQVAEKHGYTPGELKQIAFAAALMVELRAPKAFKVSEEPKDGER